MRACEGVCAALRRVPTHTRTYAPHSCRVCSLAKHAHGNSGAVPVESHAPHCTRPRQRGHAGVGLQVPDPVIVHVGEGHRRPVSGPKCSNEKCGSAAADGCALGGLVVRASGEPEAVQAEGHTVHPVSVLAQRGAGPRLHVPHPVRTRGVRAKGGEGMKRVGGARACMPVGRYTRHTHNVPLVTAYAPTCTGQGCRGFGAAAVAGGLSRGAPHSFVARTRE